MSRPGGIHRPTRPRGTVAIVAGCLIAVGGAGAVAWGLRPDSSPDAATSSAPAASESPQSGSSAPTTGATPGADTSSSVPPNRSVLPNPTSNSTPEMIANPAGAACIPASLTVSSVGIAGERVVPMGTNSQGQIYPPARTTMWYNRSVQPGQKGISVIAGHVTYDGPDNFYNLRKVGIGSRVSVTCTNGRSVALRVTAKESVSKAKLTTDQRVWGGSATAVVTLVTCDDTSRRVNGHYLNNYVVWARPA